MARLGDVVKIAPSTASLTGEQHWLLNLDMVEQQTGRIIEYHYVDAEELDGSIVQFGANAVLYSKLRPNLNKVVLPEMAGFATSEMLPLVPDTSVLSRSYLAYFLRSEPFVTWAVSKTAGAKMPRLGSKELLGKEIPIPSLAEQSNIAAQFEKVDSLISLRKQQIAKLDELVKARFVEMFGDPKDNGFNWDTVSLGSLFSVGSSKRIYQNEQVPQGIPFLRISDLMERIEHGIDTAELFISKEKFDELQQDGLVPKCGDILVTSRGTLGRCYEIKSDDQFYFQDGMISWLSERSDQINNTYIMNLFSMPGFRKQIDDVPAGSTVNYLSLARLKSLQVMCPPIDLQHQFAAFVAQTDQQKSTIQHSLAQLELLKKALMQKYFG